MNLVLLCKGQVIKGSSADSVLRSLYVSGWLYWKQFQLMRELWKWHFLSHFQYL